MTLRGLLKVNPVVVFLYYLPIKAFLIIARFFPLQRKIVFDNFCGRGLGDDPKYILLQMIKDGINAKYIWLTNDLSIEVPPEVTKVKFGSWEAEYHYITAKIWVDNVKNAHKPSKRKGQFYLQTWHGSFANKMVEKDAENTLSSEYIRMSQEDSSKIDMMYSNNDFKIAIFKKSFWYSGPVIKSDSPQLSVLFSPPRFLKEKIFYQFKIDDKYKILLYAPTFRRNGNFDVYKWDYQSILQVLEKKFKSPFVLFFRLHPNLQDRNTLCLGEHVFDVTDYPDMDELIAISDIMITDFSGVAYDMALVRKPVFLFALDYKDYIANDRLQYFETKQLPFTFAQNKNELEQHILSFNDELYQKHVESFFKIIGMNESGNGAKNIANLIGEYL